MRSFVPAMKQAAIEAIANSKPVTWVYGTVVETSPIMVQIDQKITLSANTGLVLLKGTVLSVDDKVVLLRAQGGQQYLVLGVMN